MPNVNINRRVVFSGNRIGPYTSAFKTVVESRGGSLTASELIYLTTFENSLGADIIEFDRLWIHGLSNSIAARNSFVNPSSTIITEVNSPTFTANQGYTGNSATMALETNYNLLSQSVKYTQDSSSGFAYTRVNINGAGLALGAYSAPNISAAFYPRFGGNNIFYNNANAGVDGIASVSDSLGLFSVVRTNSTDITAYKRGVNIGTMSRTSVSLINDSPYILGCKGLSLSGNQISLSGFGSGAINQSNFYNAVQALGTSIGWAV